jgi:hypothetical protein
MGDEGMYRPFSEIRGIYVVSLHKFNFSAAAAFAAAAAARQRYKKNWEAPMPLRQNYEDSVS